jgi:carbon monoxide dehydrogenase subunit G
MPFRDLKLDKSKRNVRAAVTAASVFVVALAMAMLGLMIMSPAARADGLSQSDMQRVAAGEAVVRVDAADSPADGMVVGVVEIPAPPARVWQVLFDCAHAADVMPNLTSCKVLQSGPKSAWDIREHRISWISLLPEIRSEFRSEYVTGRSIRFSRTGGDMRALDGEWRLEPLAKGAAARLTYNARVGFGALIPGFVIRNALAKDVPGFLNAIRREAVRLDGAQAAAR